MTIKGISEVPKSHSDLAPYAKSVATAWSRHHELTVETVERAALTRAAAEYAAKLAEHDALIKQAATLSAWLGQHTESLRSSVALVREQAAITFRADHEALSAFEIAPEHAAVHHHPHAAATTGATTGTTTDEDKT